MSTPQKLAIINTGHKDAAFPQHYTQLTQTVNKLLQIVQAQQGTSTATAPAAASGKLDKNSAAALAVAKGL